MTILEDFLKCSLQAGVVVAPVGVVSPDELQGNYIYVQCYELATFVHSRPKLFRHQMLIA